MRGGPGDSVREGERWRERWTPRLPMTPGSAASLSWSAEPLQSYGDRERGRGHHQINEILPTKNF